MLGLAWPGSRRIQEVAIEALDEEEELKQRDSPRVHAEDTGERIPEQRLGVLRRRVVAQVEIHPGRHTPLIGLAGRLGPQQPRDGGKGDIIPGGVQAHDRRHRVECEERCGQLRFGKIIERGQGVQGIRIVRVVLGDRAVGAHEDVVALLGLLVDAGPHPQFLHELADVGLRLRGGHPLAADLAQGPIGEL